MSSSNRMIIHVLSLAVPIAVVATSREITVSLLVAITAIFTLSEFVRLKGGKVPFVTAFTLQMSRPYEQAHFVIRPAYLAIGIIATLLTFPRNIAFASIAIVGVGDPVAACVGHRIGHLHLGRKTLEGFIAGLIASSIVASIFVPPIVGFVGSIAAMCFELLTIIDDNLTMPIGAGAAMHLFTIL